MNDSMLESQESEIRNKTLANGWEWARLEDICLLMRAGGTPLTSKTAYYHKGTIPFVKIDDMVTAGKYLTDTLTRITQDGLDSCSAWLVPAGSLLYSMYASYGEPTINRIEVATNQAIMACILPTKQVNLDYVYYFLKKVKPELRTRGTTQANLNGAIVKQISIPIAPYAEQNRIVSKIEELFTKLDAGIDALKKAKMQTKVYRQILINAACMGKLTATWRTKNTLEPAMEMLKRILKVTEKELELSVEGIVLPKIPDNWAWINLRRIAEIRQGVTKGRKFDGKKTVWLPYLRVANVQDGYLDLSEIKTIEVLPEDVERYRLRKGDVLFNEGGDRDKLGRGCVWNEEVPNCIHQNHVFRARLVSGDILPEYLTIFSKSQFARNHFFRYASQTVNLASLNMTNLGNLPVAIPTSPEQKKIVEEVERQLSILDNLESTIRQNLKQAGMLRQSILGTAFRGGLVSQDPSDELAALLLQRIQTEKAKCQQSNERRIKAKVEALKQRRLK